MAHLDINSVSFTLPDGRVLLDDVSFRVSSGTRVALIGANGAGKTTLMRVITGELTPDSGAITLTGSLGVMRQFIARPGDTVHDLLLSVASPALRHIAAQIEALELELMDTDDEVTQMKYAQALADWGDAGGYELEVLWDVCTTAALGLPYERCRWRDLDTLSGGEQKRLVLESLLRGRDEILLLDEPDNYLDVPTKEWLEEQLRLSDKALLFISHDRELLAAVATAIVTLELGAGGNSAWVHSGAFTTYDQARADRFARFAELRRRWDEEHNKLKALVAMYKVKAAYNDDLASRYRAAQTRLARFEAVGPPTEQPREQQLGIRLDAERSGKRVLVCEALGLTGLMEPFSTEVWFGDRVAVLGSNGSGKSHLLRLLAGGGTEPEVEHEPVGDMVIDPVPHTGRARLGARVRPGWFAQTHRRPDLAGRDLLGILHRGDAWRSGMPREGAMKALNRYELAAAANQHFDQLSGGQQARFQILLLELSGANLLLLDEPTDHLDLVSAHALQQALRSFAGTVIAVTHDRWFARDFDRFLIFSADGSVRFSPSPVWDEARVVRER